MDTFFPGWVLAKHGEQLVGDNRAWRRRFLAGSEATRRLEMFSKKLLANAWFGMEQVG